MAKASEWAGKAAGKVKKVVSELQGDKGIFAELKADHQEVSTLMKQVEVLPSRDGTRRLELLRTIRQQLEAHDRAEERIFYSRLQHNSETEQRVAHRDEQHRTAEELALQLESLDPAGDRWMDLFKHFRQEVERHVQAEEDQIFPLAHGVIDDQEAEYLGDQFREQKEAELRITKMY